MHSKHWLLGLPEPWLVGLCALCIDVGVGTEVGWRAVARHEVFFVFLVLVFIRGAYAAEHALSYHVARPRTGACLNGYAFTKIFQ